MTILLVFWRPPHETSIKVCALVVSCSTLTQSVHGTSHILSLEADLLCVCVYIYKYTLCIYNVYIVFIHIPIMYI